ncbi:miniconductance mechanosensitive channel MscM [Escherichia coli]|nr:miniconductance mechanosensitive channel MscM [Escherichia coli]
MRLIITFLMAWCLSWGAYAATAPDSKQITQELEQAKAAKPAQPEVVEALQSALNALEERKGSLERIKQYQEVIDNYPKLSATLRAQLNNMRDEPRSVSPGMSNDALNQEILQISSQLLDKSRQAQQEQERAREIADSLNQLPQQQTDARRQLNEIERRLGTLTGNTPLNQAQNFALQSDSARLKALVDELELAQLSANNRQELARLRSELAEKESQQLDAYLQALRNQLNSQRQQEAERALESTEQLAESSADLPKDIVAQFKINRELSAALNQQAQRMDLVASQQRQAASQTLQVRQALNTLREQSQWLGSSNLLGEALRAQVARLPEMPKPQQLDTEMAQLRVQRLRYEDLLNKQPLLRQIHQADGQPLTAEQNRILEAQLRTQRELLNSLLQGGDTLLLELTKLKVSNGQLEDALKEVNEATHRYLFWTSDVRPMTIAWPLEIAQDLRRLISLDTFSQLGKASVMMLTSKETILPLFGALILVGCSIYSRRYFTRFLERSAAKVGKVTQDHFWLTLRTLFWSILVASPLPVLWMTLGYGLREAWPYPLAVAIGDGVTATVPLLWVVMICATFARPNGLFIAHFGWPRERVSRGMRYYLMSIGLIVPLIMALMMFDNLDDREFSGSLGRLCFILICGALAVVTLSLKKAGIPLYLNKEGSGDNITNHMLWNMMIGGLVGFSMIGIEWSKLQWLVAALGVGLGFGLQEIFANFISGLIILFEKPIRIGDTVTIRDLTGSVTKINTRATTISDWDRKEIIVPNKAFITEQFINWSLSDSVTRVVLTIPAPADANSEEVTEILLTAARRCSLVIDNPAPEVFLVDLQQGIQIFELRIYAAEMGHRMPLRHEIHQLILAGFHAHGIDMPFPPFQMRLESLNGKQTGRTLTSAGKDRQAGSL